MPLLGFLGLCWCLFGGISFKKENMSSKKIVLHKQDVNITIHFYFEPFSEKKRNIDVMDPERMKEIFLHCLRIPKLSKIAEGKIIEWLNEKFDMKITENNINKYKI